MQPLIDTHCHLNDPVFAETLPAVLERARAAGVRACVVPAYDGPSLARTSQVASLYPGEILPAYGLHPWFVSSGADLMEVRNRLQGQDAVAVGEIGLDASDGCPPLDLQISFFRAQLDLAAALGLPVLIHCRKAYDALYACLLPYRGRLQGILHSYSGGKGQMPRFLELGFSIAFSGSVTRPNARRYAETAAAVPLDRFLLETDAPSIATATRRASEVEPCHIVEIANKIADLRCISLAGVCEQTWENACRLFGGALR